MHHIQNGTTAWSIYPMYFIYQLMLPRENWQRSHPVTNYLSHNFIFYFIHSNVRRYFSSFFNTSTLFQFWRRREKICCLKSLFLNTKFSLADGKFSTFFSLSYFQLTQNHIWKLIIKSQISLLPSTSQIIIRLTIAGVSCSKRYFSNWTLKIRRNKSKEQSERDRRLRKSIFCWKNFLLTSHTEGKFSFYNKKNLLRRIANWEWIEKVFFL